MLVSSALIVLLISLIGVFANNLVLALIYVALYLCILTFLKQSERIQLQLYNLSLILNIFGVIVTSLLFEFNLGSVYGANDEFSFQDKILRLSDGWERGRNTSLDTDAFGWGYPLALITYLSALLGMGNIFVAKLFSALVGAFVPVYAYRLAQEFFSSKSALYAAIFILVSGLFIYYSSVGVRDIHIAVLIMAIFYNLVKAHDKKFGFGVELLTVLALTILLYTIRPENAYFMILVITIYQFLGIQGSMVYRLLNGLMLSIVVGVVVTYYWDILMSNSLDLYIDSRISYAERVDLASSNSSIVQRLREVVFPLNVVLVTIAGYFGPFPAYRLLESPFIQNGNIDGLAAVSNMFNFSPARFLKTEGIVLWQLLNIYCVFSIKKIIAILGERRLLYLAFMSMLYVGLVSWISLNEGRIFVVYPIFVIVLVASIYEPVKIRQFWSKALMTLLFYIGLNVVYILMKN